MSAAYRIGYAARLVVEVVIGVVVAATKAAWKLRAELAVCAAVMAGWCLVTHGIASLTTPKVWPISIGLFLLLACGWRFLWQIATHGLYTLTRRTGA